MIDIVLVIDDQDEVMGTFNRSCLQTFQEYFEENQINAIYIKSTQLNALSLKLQLEARTSFIFAAYTHGNENGELLSSTNIDPYLSTSVNNTYFNKAFVYSVSCHAGIELGKALLDNGCLNFFGYNSFFHFWDGYKCFPNCANLGLFLFFENNSSKQIYIKMMNNYNKYIDELYTEDYLVASLLRENRDSLIHLGNDIKIKDLN